MFRFLLFSERLQIYNFNKKEESFITLIKSCCNFVSGKLYINCFKISISYLDDKFFSTSNVIVRN